MNDITTSGASSIENVSVSNLAKHVQSLADRITELEQEVTEKENRINELEEQVTKQAPIEWRGEEKKAENIWVGPYPPGKAVERHGE
ncbi:hypothetical protein [Haladaptatus litoreus]|uniref:hypothetical protein n=1 Tax=Haladaptatus litoreus TaxID=553468 RepID=UPI0009705525|nr:hypothetical protein [Haladaptatus litoreus]